MNACLKSSVNRNEQFIRLHLIVSFKLGSEEWQGLEQARVGWDFGRPKRESGESEQQPGEVAVGSIVR